MTEFKKKNISDKEVEQINEKVSEFIEKIKPLKRGEIKM